MHLNDWQVRGAPPSQTLLSSDGQSCDITFVWPLISFSIDRLWSWRCESERFYDSPFRVFCLVTHREPESESLKCWTLGRQLSFTPTVVGQHLQKWTRDIDRAWTGSFKKVSFNLVSFEHAMDFYSLWKWRTEGASWTRGETFHVHLPNRSLQPLPLE